MSRSNEDVLNSNEYLSFPFWVIELVQHWRNYGVSFIMKVRSSHQRCSVKKGVLRNFAKFTGKHLCQSLFFNKVAGLRPKAYTFFTEHPWTTASGK